jgi:HK97 family phage portal protein
MRARTNDPMNPITTIYSALKTAVVKLWGRGSSIFVPRKAAGMHVDEHTALTLSPVWACVKVISETIATLPWHVYERDGRARNQMPGNPADWILSIQANPEMTAFQMRRFLVASALLWGNGYAEIQRDVAGRPLWLWPITPDRVTPERDAEGSLVFKVVGDHGDYVYLSSDEMFHLPGMGYDGVTGYSVVAMAARSIGVGLASEEFAASFFANGTHPAGILTTDGALNTEQQKQLKESWDEKYGGGPKGAQKTAVLFGGLKWQALTMPLHEAQFLESRKYSVRDICRWFRVPPHKIADLDNATFTNIEHQAIEFVTDGLVPWITLLEQIANIKLIGRNMRGRVYTKINVNALLRGDFATRSAAYAQGRLNGWYSANDIREMEDLNPVDGGDEYLVQSQMVPANMLREIAESDMKKQEQPPNKEVTPIKPASAGFFTPVKNERAI